MTKVFNDSFNVNGKTCIFDSNLFKELTKKFYCMKILIPIISISLDSNGIHLLLETKIGKTETEAFVIIDTGASKSVIDQALLCNDDFSVIQTDIVESSQLTDMISGEIISIHKIQFGNYMFETFEALTMPLHHVNSIYNRFVDKPIAGLLGGDFLSKYKAVISYSKMELSLTISKRSEIKRLKKGLTNV